MWARSPNGNVLNRVRHEVLGFLDAAALLQREADQVGARNRASVSTRFLGSDVERRRRVACLVQYRKTREILKTCRGFIYHGVRGDGAIIQFL